MTIDSAPAPQPPALPEEERARIRAEMRYAMVAAQEARPAESPKKLADKVLGYLSNGFVLLLLGSLITAGLVPHFQRAYESRARQAALKQECLSQFLLYSNSIWQEYYSIFPATLETDLDKESYLKYMNEISRIKLGRYDAYSKVQALALVFRGADPATPSAVESALSDYAVKVNRVSTAIDGWLKDVYCTPTKRETSPCARFDKDFDPFERFQAIQKLVVDLGNESTQRVAEVMVDSIKSSH